MMYYNQTLSTQVAVIEVLIIEPSLELRRWLRDRAFAYIREALGLFPS